MTFAVTHCGGEEAARLELLQSHGAGVGPKEQDEGHQGDVRHIATGLSNQLPSILLTLLHAQGRPGGIYWLRRRGQRSFFNQQYLGKKYNSVNECKSFEILNLCFDVQLLNVIKTGTPHTRSVLFVQAETSRSSEELPSKEKQ